MPKLFLVVPVFNEAPNLPTFLSGVGKIGAELGSQFEVQCLILDDGSTDETVATIRAYSSAVPVTIVSHPTNLGPGAAFASGFEWLAGRLQAEDWVLTLEGDNTSRLELLKQMLQRSQEGYEVILASPYMYPGGISNTTALRVFLSFVANFFVKELLGLRGLVTMSSFYRLYRGSVILRLQKTYGARILECSGFESMIELLMKMVYFRMLISEVPMHLDSSLRKGKSKMKIVKTMFGYLKLWGYKSKWAHQGKQGALPFSATPTSSPTLR